MIKVVSGRPDLLKVEKSEFELGMNESVKLLLKLTKQDQISYAGVFLCFYELAENEPGTLLEMVEIHIDY